MGIWDETQENWRGRGGKRDHQCAIVEVIAKKSMGDYADILDFGEIDGIIVVLQKNGFSADDDPAIGDNHQVKIIIDDLKEKGVDEKNGDDDHQKSEKGIEKGDFEHEEDGTQDQEEKKPHGPDQKTEKNGLQKMGPVPAEKELDPLELQRWSGVSSLTHKWCI
jgi:hypothetical protein